MPKLKTPTGWDLETDGQYLAAQGSNGAPTYSFSTNKKSGLYFQAGAPTLVSDNGIVQLAGSVAGATPGIIELYLTPVAGSGTDGTIQMNGGAAPGQYNFRIVNVGSGVKAGAWEVRCPDFSACIAITGPITTGDYPSGQGAVVFPNTALGTPFIIRKKAGTPGTNETWIYQDTLSLNITPKEPSAKINLNAGLLITPQNATLGNLDFTSTKFTDTGFRAYTNDGAPFAGTGLIQLRAADASGLTTMDAANTTGLRIRALSFDGSTVYSVLTMNSTGAKFSGAFGINGKAPVANVAAPTAASAAYGATEQALLNDIRTRLINFGVYT